MVPSGYGFFLRAVAFFSASAYQFAAISPICNTIAGMQYFLFSGANFFFHGLEVFGRVKVVAVASFEDYHGSATINVFL
jgi:hypothetical protein